VRAQTGHHGATATPTVFLECEVCGSDYVRTALPGVSYVRDRTEAQVYVLVTTLETRAQGTEYTLTLLGQGSFHGVDDTLHWTAGPGAPEDETRHAVTHLLQLGLVRYAAAPPVGSTLDVVYNASDSTASLQLASQRLDLWYNWVFNTGVNGILNGQQD
jgi:hypothetical protein